MIVEKIKLCVAHCISVHKRSKLVRSIITERNDINDIIELPPEDLQLLKTTLHNIRCWATLIETETKIITDIINAETEKNSQQSKPATEE